MLAGAGFAFVQSADRLVLSSAASIYDFAHYSLAASTMFVPMTIITAISRVFFPHLAVADREQHHAMYQQGSRLVLVAWTVLLPYYIFVDLFVRHFLPRYEASLPIARVLALAVLFFGSILILQMNVFNLYGQQRRFFMYSAVAVSCSLGLAYIGARHFHSLVMVAATQVITAGAWWLVNAWKLRHITQERSGDWRRTLLIFAWSTVSLWLAMDIFHSAVLQLCAYYALIAIPTWVCFREELAMLARFSGTTRIASAMLLARPGDDVGD
jgi:O-antigen/teichoic acid export membrane protein